MKTKQFNNIVHHRTMEIILKNNTVKDSSKPLINEIRDVVERRISFDEQMRLAYCQPKWQWN
ncbi:MAG: hypothetical protein KDC84_13730 [Crocinitomicaceae bacterium]|nr:hypothetical protein [Crocinitomicaceae bacterium]